MSKLKVEISTLPPRNIIWIDVFNHIILFTGYPILLCGFKMGDEVLDLLGLGAIFIGNGVDGEFILGYNNEL